MQKPGILWILEYSKFSHPDAYSEPCHIYENLQIFRNLKYLKTNTYSLKKELFTKVVKNYNYFSKALHLGSWTMFWISLPFNKDSLTCRVTSYYALFDTNSEHCVSSKIQTYLGIFTSYSDIFNHIVPYLEPCVTLAYSDLYHIQNTGTFRTKDISLSSNIQNAV